MAIPQIIIPSCNNTINSHYSSSKKDFIKIHSGIQHIIDNQINHIIQILSTKFNFSFQDAISAISHDSNHHDDSQLSDSSFSNILHDNHTFISHTLSDKDSLKAQKLAEKEALKSQKLAEKEALKSQKLAEKEALKAQKLAEKEALKAQKLAEKEALKSQKLAEKEALKAQKLAEKLAEKEAPYSTPSLKKKPGRPKSLHNNNNNNNNNTKKPRGRPPKSKTIDLPPTDTIISSLLHNNSLSDSLSDYESYNTFSAKTIIIDNIKFIITPDFTLYDFISREPVGTWNQLSYSSDSIIPFD